jgi:hypothetical protein
LLDLLCQLFLVGDRGSDLLLRLEQLRVHVEHDLIQHLLGILRPADQIVQVCFEERREPCENSHERLF